MASARTRKKNGNPDLKTICRLCLTPDIGTINIFHSQMSIPVRIMACASLEVQPTDGLPSLICEKCRYLLEVSYCFRKKCQISDGKLRKHIRLINASRKSRVFEKSTNEDDEDEEELQCAESMKFIKAEDDKLKAIEEAKQLKLLEEQKEQFRQEETQHLFEEFVNFMQSRKSGDLQQTSSAKGEEIDIEDDEDPQNNYQSEPQEEKFPTRQLGSKLVLRKNLNGRCAIDDDNEITSSEQIPDGEEQTIFYSEDDEGSQENTNHSMEAFFVFGKEDVGDGSHMIEETQNNMDEDDMIGVVDEQDEVNNGDSEIEVQEGFILPGEFEPCDVDEYNKRIGDVVQAYNIEEADEIQYLKEEELPENISTSVGETKEHISDYAEADFKDETKVEMLPPRRINRKSTETAKPKKQPKLTTPKAIDVAISVTTDDLKIFKCSDCPQSFTRANSLLRHKSAHRKGRDYTCDYCEKFFSCKSSLDRHIRIHTGEKPFTCEECGKNFMQKEVLKRHLAIHTGDRPHKCPHCPRAFVQKLMMTQHINATHLEIPQIQKHVCHLCPKSFIHASGMSRHLQTHSGQKFSCKECERVFNDKSSLRRHLMAIHEKKILSEIGL